MAVVTANVFSDASNMNRTVAWLDRLRKSGTLCDVTLNISGKCIRVHSNVLSAASPYFAFVLGMKDEEKDIEQNNFTNAEIPQVINPQIIHINVDTFSKEDRDIYFTAMQRLVDYIYTGKLHVEDVFVAQILQLSKLFKTNKVTKLCEKFLRNIESEDINMAVTTLEESEDQPSDDILFVDKDVASVSNVKPQLEYKSNKCKSCGFIGRTQRDLRDHRHRMHIIRIAGVNTCPYCAKEYSDKRELESHKLLHNSTDVSYRYSCAFCVQKFNWKWQLRKHMIKHSTVKQFICPLCQGHYKREKTLLKHIQLHKRQDIPDATSAHGKRRVPTIINPDGQNGCKINAPFDCKTCAREFITHSSLLTHMKTHTHPDPVYHCHECQHSTTNRNELERHLLWRHRIADFDTEPPVFVTAVVEESKVAGKTRRYPAGSFACDTCGKVFSMKHILRRHVLDMHTDARPFKCSVCGFTTKRKGNLKDHMWYRHKLALPVEASPAPTTPVEV